MRQHGQEFVLAPALLFQPRLGLTALRDLGLQVLVQPRGREGGGGALRELVDHRLAQRGQRAVQQQRAEQAVAVAQRVNPQAGPFAALVGPVGHQQPGRRPGVVGQLLHQRAFVGGQLVFVHQPRHAILRAAAQQVLRPALVVEQQHRRARRHLRHQARQQFLHADARLQHAGQRMAQVRQAGRAPVRFLGRLQSSSRGRQRHALVRLPGDAPLQHRQFDEDPHLGAKDLGHHRRQDVVDRAQRVAAAGLDLVRVGGDEDDGGVRRSLVTPDESGRLQPVDVGHVDVQQDHRELARQYLAQGLGARAHADDVLLQVLQHRLEDHQLLGQVVDDQDVHLVAVTVLDRGLGRAGRQKGFQRHSHPLKTASRCCGSTGLDR
jgi:hypothetical protein